MLKRLGMKVEKVSCDVLVVGAGVSGVAAAVSAARQGAKVILIEKSSFCGGTAIKAMHRHICGLQPKGLSIEIAAALSKLDPESKMISMGRVRVFPFRTGKLKTVLGRLVKSEVNIKCFYGAEAFSVRKNKNNIAGVKARCSNKTLNINFKAVVDASGEGVVIKLSKAGHKIASLKNRQLGGFSFRLKGIGSGDSLLPLKIPYYIRKGIEGRELPRYFRFASFVSSGIRGEGICKFSIPYIRGFNINKNAAIAHNYLSKKLPELKDSYIISVSGEVAQREGLRILGEYTLTKNDIVGARKFRDAVVRANWPIEFWHQNYGQQLEYIPKGKFYEIPLRCLRSVNIRNLFAAGKCISAEPHALASTRVMGTAIASGEAAGVAAKKYAHTLS